MLLCPQCKTPLQKGDEGHFCSSCSFFIPYVFREKRLSEKQIHQLVSRGETSYEEWKRRDSGGLFLGKLVITPHYKISFVPFYLRGGICPYCGSKLIKTPFAWECTTRDLSISQKVAERPLSDQEVRQLLIYKKTDYLDGFVSKETGKRFSAYLILNEEKEVEFLFK